MSLRLIGTSALLAGAALFCTPSVDAATPSQCTARGPLNSYLPSHVLMGINSSSPGDDWAAQSGTRWDVQWVYLSGQAGNDWYNGFGSVPADGSWIDDFFRTIDGHGFVPGIHLYNIGYGHDQPSTAPGILGEVQSASWTKQYFTEFEALMRRAKAFGKPVVIVLEGD
ncbi:MAG: hypothetical protein JOZ69_11555, partial [Myxococcales bacterium]|nr:hypothetical protein [Myxococcales bacterium]